MKAKELDGLGGVNNKNNEVVFDLVIMFIKYTIRLYIGINENS